MSREVFMLDTNICSFLIRKRPDYLLDKLQQTVVSGHQVVVSAITYAELKFGAASRKASPKAIHCHIVFCVARAFPPDAIHRQLAV